jgi:hypothetical protein
MINFPGLLALVYFVGLFLFIYTSFHYWAESDKLRAKLYGGSAIFWPLVGLVFSLRWTAEFVLRAAVPRRFEKREE